MKQKVILFGGTFDPIHCGHLQVAEHAARALDGSETVFIPAARSPHKREQPRASGGDRLAMIHLAIAGCERMGASDCELRRAAPSYTVDTVQEFRAAYGADAELYWLIGADMVKDLPRWHRAAELIDSCRVAVMYRGGWERPRFEGVERELGPGRAARLRQDVIATPDIDISSTEVRRRVAAGEGLEGLVPQAVAEYIRERGLYR